MGSSSSPSTAEHAKSSGEGSAYTPNQRALLDDLSQEPHSWMACEQLGHPWQTAVSLRRRGLVETEKCGEWFDCRLTEAGRAAVAKTEVR